MPRARYGRAGRNVFDRRGGNRVSTSGQAWPPGDTESDGVTYGTPVTLGAEPEAEAPKAKTSKAAETSAEKA